jgi:hypothetical protein
MYQKAITQEEVAHICSPTALRKLNLGYESVRMKTADKLYQYLVKRYKSDHAVAGLPFEQWHDKIFEEMEAYRQKIGISKASFARMLGLHSVQYYDLLKGVRLSGKRMWSAYENYKNLKR